MVRLQSGSEDDRAPSPIFRWNSEWPSSHINSLNSKRNLTGGARNNGLSMNRISSNEKKCQMKKRTKWKKEKTISFLSEKIISIQWHVMHENVNIHCKAIASNILCGILLNFPLVRFRVSSNELQRLFGCNQLVSHDRRDRLERRIIDSNHVDAWCHPEWRLPTFEQASNWIRAILRHCGYERIN